LADGIGAILFRLRLEVLYSETAAVDAVKDRIAVWQRNESVDPGLRMRRPQTTSQNQRISIGHGHRTHLDL
jgi:hypothetical protein